VHKFQSRRAVRMFDSLFSFLLTLVEFQICEISNLAAFFDLLRAVAFSLLFSRTVWVLEEGLDEVLQFILVQEASLVLVNQTEHLRQHLLHRLLLCLTHLLCSHTNTVLTATVALCILLIVRAYMVAQKSKPVSFIHIFANY